jgi:hypothetical protein
MCFAGVNQSAVALGVGLGSLRIVAGTQFHRLGCAPVPENDITPHCLQCVPVTALKLRLVAPTTGAPCGCRQQALCQILPLESGRPPSVLPGHCVPYAPPSAALMVCWHLGISQALRAVCLVSGLRPVILCVPRPPVGLACFAA